MLEGVGLAGDTGCGSVDEGLSANMFSVSRAGSRVFLDSPGCGQ